MSDDHALGRGADLVRQMRKGWNMVAWVVTP
jgi:hypothetical protein